MSRWETRTVRSGTFTPRTRPRTACRLAQAFANRIDAHARQQHSMRAVTWYWAARLACISHPLGVEKVSTRHARVRAPRSADARSRVRPSKNTERPDEHGRWP